MGGAGCRRAVESGSGRVGRALAAADGARDSVVEEVARLVRASAASSTGERGVARPPPYRGLSSYGPMDADVFVGRERLVAELATRVLDHRVVVVAGSFGQRRVVAPAGRADPAGAERSAAGRGAVARRRGVQARIRCGRSTSWPTWMSLGRN